MNLTILITTILLTLSCSQKEGKDRDVTTDIPAGSIVNLNLEKGIDNAIEYLNLSDVASAIEIVPLEFTDKSMIKDIDIGANHNIGITEDDIIITTYRQLLHFSRDGKFLNEIGRFGNGPEEYRDTHFCMILEPNKEIYVLTGQSTKVYNFDGSFEKEVSKLTSEEMFSGGEGKILCHSGQFFLSQKLPLLTPKGEFWSIALVDENLNIQKKIFNPDYIDRYQELIKEENMVSYTYYKNYFIEQPMNADYYSGRFKIKYDAIDTIYQYNEQNRTFNPVYSLALGGRPSFEMSHSWLKDPAFFNYLWVYDFYDSKDFLYFLAGKGEMVYTVRYNKTSGEMQAREDKSTIRVNRLFTVTHRRLERQFKLTNDMSGGVDFTVDLKTPGGYWVSVNQPSDLLEKIDIEELKKADVKDKAARDRLVKVLSGLSEDDNPVLIIAKLK